MDLMDVLLVMRLCCADHLLGLAHFFRTDMLCSQHNDNYGIVAEHFFISEERCINPLNSGDDYIIQYIEELDAIVVDYKYLGMMCLGMIKNHKYSTVPLEYWGMNS
jgi:hypothetical protein